MIARVQQRGDAEREPHFLDRARAQQRPARRSSSGSATATVSAPSVNTNGSTSMCVRRRGVDQRGRRRLGFGSLQVDDRDVKLFAEGTRDVDLGDQPELSELLTEPMPVAHLGGLLNRLTRDRPTINEEITEPRGDPDSGRVRHQHRRRGATSMRCLITAASHSHSLRSNSRTAKLSKGGATHRGPDLGVPASFDHKVERGACEAAEIFLVARCDCELRAHFLNRARQGGVCGEVSSSAWKRRYRSAVVPDRRRDAQFTRCSS